MIRQIVAGRLICPTFFCDWCGERITDAGNGQYLWHYDKERQGSAPVTVRTATGEEYRADVFFVHGAGTCNRHFETVNSFEPGRRAGWAWETLDVLPVYLGENLPIDWQAARERAALFASL